MECVHTAKFAIMVDFIPQFICDKNHTIHADFTVDFTADFKCERTLRVWSHVADCSRNFCDKVRSIYLNNTPFTP